MNVRNRILGIALSFVAIIMASIWIAYFHFPSDQYGYTKWAVLASSIAGGFLAFAAVCIYDGTILHVLPTLLIGLACPAVLFTIFVKRGSIWALVIASGIWVLEGWMVNIGASF